MSGIMGEPQHNTQPEISSASDRESQDITPASTAPSTRRKVGRPKKGETPVKSDEIRATFIVSPDDVRKLKYISLMQQRLLKEVVGDALAKFIAEWEASNGRIRLPK